MPLLLDHTNEMQPKGQVSTIKGFLQSCVKVLNDPSSMKILQNILEKCSIEMELVLAQGHTQGSTPRAHQQALTTGPFGYTCEVDAVSPEAAMGGLEERSVYNQGEYQVDPIPEQYNMHISLINLDLLHTPIKSITTMQ
jgi:hypothetical protein